jgi:hypothetical protein
MIVEKLVFGRTNANGSRPERLSKHQTTDRDQLPVGAVTPQRLHLRRLGKPAKKRAEEPAARLLR